MDITITSNSFNNEDNIPSKYTCDGDNISPGLNWSNIPNETKSLAIIMDDPDAPSGDFVHWLIYNIPANVNNIQENSSTTKNLPDEVRFGTNSLGRIGYTGPCPPSGTHHYHFKIYALNAHLHLDAGVSKKELLRAMEGHTLAKGEMVKLYKRN